MASIAHLWELVTKGTTPPWEVDGADLSARVIADVGAMEITSVSSPFVRSLPSDDAALIAAAVNNLPFLLTLATAAKELDQLIGGYELAAIKDIYRAREIVRQKEVIQCAIAAMEKTS